ncbi:hypothetical protein MKW92_038319 [Papaver armeniacum]|nr:hypothetical protein MKW92_038319 [Papaver armeniacum]
MDPVEEGLGCGSDAAHLSLLVYDPRVYYRGRGAFELWSNLATLDETSGVDRLFEEGRPILCAALDKLKLPSFPEYEVRFRYAREHRCGVVVEGPKLSGNISGAPLKDNRLPLKAKPLDDTEGKHTAAVVPPFEKKHGLWSCMVAPTKIIAGWVYLSVLIS